MNRSPQQQAAFDAWKSKADGIDLLSTAASFGAKLRRAGREHVGPCPACNGTDRFSINPSKSVWNCRGSEGGHDAIGLAMHCGGLSFMQAIEHLTGEPPPSGRSAPLSAEVRAEIERRKAESKARQQQLMAEQAAYEEDTHEAAMALWYQSKPIKGSLAETYLNRRGLPTPADGWTPVLRYHPALPYPGKAKFPALVCRVDDVLGELTAIWRIFLKHDGSGKAEVENAKLGLGPAGGGAVRIGGLAAKIGVAEGVESALGAWMLMGCKAPVWAALSTSGMIGLEVPLAVRHLTVYPDGDAPMRRQNGEFVAAVPPGRAAALNLQNRLKMENTKCVIAGEPPVGRDYLDLWLQSARAAA